MPSLSLGPQVQVCPLWGFGGKSRWTVGTLQGQLRAQGVLGRQGSLGSFSVAPSPRASRPGAGVCLAGSSRPRLHAHVSLELWRGAAPPKLLTLLAFLCFPSLLSPEQAERPLRVSTETGLACPPVPDVCPVSMTGW